MPTDPVCGMYVPETSNLFLDIDGEKYYFCSTGCLEKYRSPEEEYRELRCMLKAVWAIGYNSALVSSQVEYRFCSSASRYIHFFQSRQLLWP